MRPQGATGGRAEGPGSTYWLQHMATAPPTAPCSHVPRPPPWPWPWPHVTASPAPIGELPLAAGCRGCSMGAWAQGAMWRAGAGRVGAPTERAGRGCRQGYWGRHSLTRQLLPAPGSLPPPPPPAPDWTASTRGQSISPAMTRALSVLLSAPRPASARPLCLRGEGQGVNPAPLQAGVALLWLPRSSFPSLSSSGLNSRQSEPSVCLIAPCQDSSSDRPAPPRRPAPPAPRLPGQAAGPWVSPGPGSTGYSRASAPKTCELEAWMPDACHRPGSM